MRKTPWKRGLLFTSAAALLGVMPLAAGCDTDDDTFEEAGEELDEGYNEMGEETEEALEDMDDELDEELEDDLETPPGG